MADNKPKIDLAGLQSAASKKTSNAADAAKKADEELAARLAKAEAEASKGE